MITGKRANGSEYSTGIPCNLKYYKTDFVEKDSVELFDDLLGHIIEMIQLQFAVRIDIVIYIHLMSVIKQACCLRWIRLIK